MLCALGYEPAKLDDLGKYRCIVNTAPAQILTAEQLQEADEQCFLLDLASMRCIPSERAVHARGLPGKCLPEASGKLIGRTILHYLNHKED